MKFNTLPPLKMLLLSFVIIFQFSCSKDSDLLTDYVLADTLNSKSIGNIVVDDTYQVSLRGSVVLDVLSNDTFENEVEVVITETSTPTNGTVVINNDETLTYTPNPEITVGAVDEFTYTAELVNEDASVSTETGNVTINVESSDRTSTTANLLFNSGFEGVAIGPPTADYRYITGIDSETGYSWPPTFWNSGVDGTPNGIHQISVDKGSQYTNELVTMVGHTGQQTTALEVSIDAFPQPYSNTQTPYQINDIGGSQLGGLGEPAEIYHKFWIRLDDMATIKDTPGQWRMIWQFKSINFDDNWVIGDGDDDAYRISLFIIANQSGELYFSTTADYQPGSGNEWWVQNSSIKVPTEEWFQVEIYDKVSTGSDGLFWIKINGTQISYKEGRNLGNNNPTSWGPDIKAPDNLRYWTLWQFYSGRTGKQWIDDIEIWDGIPY